MADITIALAALVPNADYGGYPRDREHYERLAWRDARPKPSWDEIAAWAPPGPSYRDKRKEAYIAELGQKPGDFVETVGDVLDDLIREVRALAAAPVTPEFAVLVQKIDAIKARFPKPE